MDTIMFGRKEKSKPLPELTDEGAMEAAFDAELAVIYKHSPFCPTSARAMREVQSFKRLNPEVPIYLVDVIRDRALSQQLASDLEIQHESPQAIVLRHGKPVADGSHYDVTVSQIERWCSAKTD